MEAGVKVVRARMEVDIPRRRPVIVRICETRTASPTEIEETGRPYLGEIVAKGLQGEVKDDTIVKTASTCRGLRGRFVRTARERIVAVALGVRELLLEIDAVMISEGEGEGEEEATGPNPQVLGNGVRDWEQA